MYVILNMTQHPATPEQVAQGVVDLPSEERAELSRLLTVDDLPSPEEIWDRCQAIAKLSWADSLAWADSLGTDTPITQVMVGGAPWMMAPLCRALQAAGIEQCLAAFSKRESVEHTDPITGAVTKTAVFRHIGFVEC